MVSRLLELVVRIFAGVPMFKVVLTCFFLLPGCTLKIYNLNRVLLQEA